MPIICFLSFGELHCALAYWHAKGHTQKYTKMTQQQNDTHNGQEIQQKLQLEGGPRQLYSEGDFRFEDAPKPNEGELSMMLQKR